MVSRWRYRFLAVITAVALCGLSPRAGAETLREVLREHSLSSGSAPIRNLDRRITSYEVLDTAEEFVIAYYVDDGTPYLPSSLSVAHYSKGNSRWSEASIGRKDVTFPDGSEDCIGSADGLHRLGDFFLIDTHLSPSAGCLIVLDENLAVVKLLYGWYLASLPPHIVVFHESMMHFAPTHPMKISTFDLDQEQAGQGTPSDARATSLYPPRDDRLRAQYIQRLRPLVGDENWCNQHNSHCDPERFENEVTSSVAVNRTRGAFAFVVEYSPVGIVPEETIRKTPELRERVVYVYSGADYREFPLADMKQRFGASTIEELVNPPIFDKVFASSDR